MKSISTFFVTILLCSFSSFSQSWEKIRTITKNLDNVVKNYSDELLFTASYNDYTDIDTFRIFKMKINSDNPIEIYSSTDTIRYIYISKNNTILAFKGKESLIYEFNNPNHTKYFSTRSILRSDNNGQSWNETDIKISGVTKIIEKDSGKIFLYASNFWNKHCDSNIYFSEDYGKSWLILNWKFGLIKGMSVLKDGNMLVSNDSSIYISKDNGKSWNIHTKIILPIDLSTIYENSKGQLIVKNLTSGDRDLSYMYSSIDKGLTWYQIFLTDTSNQGVKFRGIVIDTAIYAIDNKYQFFKSIDLGKSWTYLNDFTQELKDTAIYRYYSGLNINENIYFFTKSNKIFNYIEVENKLNLIYKAKTNIQYFTFRDDNLQLLLSGSYDLLRFENFNLQSLKITNSISPIGALSNKLTSLLSPNNRIIFQSNLYSDIDAEVMFSDNNGLTFHEYQDSVMFGALFFGNKNELFSAYNNKLYVSYDEGISFSILIDTIPIKTMLGGMSPVGNIYFFGSNGDYAWTSDLGNAWTSKFDRSLLGPSQIKFRSNGDIIYGGYLMFWISTDFGVNLTQIGEYCTDFNMCDMAPHANGDLFFVHNSNVIRKSKDNGKTWEQLLLALSQGLNGSIHITNSGLIFAPPYFSSDNGVTWIDTQVGGKVKSNNNGLIILIQYDSWLGGDPVFYKFNSPNGIEDEYSKISENLISPNPASDFIEISVGAQLAVSEQSDVRIYNIFGQNVKTVGVQNLEPLPIMI